MFYKFIAILLIAFSFALPSPLLASCDKWTERGIETLAFMETKNYFNKFSDFKGASEIVWRGNQRGFKSYVIKVRYLAKIPNGNMIQGCMLVAYILLKEGLLKECIRYNPYTSPKSCVSSNTLAEERNMIDHFVRLNMLGKELKNK